MNARPGHVLIELLIENLSEFLERLFKKREKSQLQEMTELNLILENKFQLSFVDLSEKPFDDLKLKLIVIDSKLLEVLIPCLYKISNTSSNHQAFQQLKSNPKLKERILEIIYFLENKNYSISLEIRNIKNSLEHQMR